MYTIGQVAKRFAISRSTLIYYDSIGVLTPSGRTESNYRLYSDADISRMEKISVFRIAGLSLEAIASLLDKEKDELDVALERRLATINTDIQSLRDQQAFILTLLENSDATRSARVITREVWVSLLQAAGLDEDGMRKWHVEFEKTSPEAHQDFLESIGIAKDEISEIREWSRSG